jgi:hypothetical protein
MLLEVGCVMKKWTATHLQPIGVPCCQCSPTTPDVATNKNSNNRKISPLQDARNCDMELFPGV